MSAVLDTAASLIRANVSYEEYAGLSGVRISALKEMKRSPLHYRHRLNNPRVGKPLSLGTAAHMAVLEPERFAAHYAVWDRKSENGNSCPRKGQYWEQFQKDNAGKEPISVSDHQAAKDIAACVRRSSLAMDYLREGEAEVSMRWLTEAHHCGALLPVWCRGRADWITRIKGRPVLVDLKTAADVQKIPFGNACARMGYHMQAAWYVDGYMELTGEHPQFVLLAVESAQPHDVVPYIVPDEVIDQGREDYLKLLTQLVECEISREWPGVADGRVQELSLPSWIYPAEAEEAGEDISDTGVEW